jgi:hypothetical protein
MQGWRRWVARIGLGIVAFVILTFVVLIIRTQGGILLLVALWLHASFSNDRPPPIAYVITPNDRNVDAINRKLTDALEKKFPAEAMLTSALLEQGFKHPSPTVLRYEWSSPACGHTITVRWTADGDGKITEIKARYHRMCL